MIEKNQFFDIKQIKDWTLVWFPISISNIGTRQGVSKCIKWLEFFNDKKIIAPRVGLNVVYADFLYLNSKEPANKLKEKFLKQIVSHKRGMKNEIYKRRRDLQIQQAFHFEGWLNLYLQTKGDFHYFLLKIKKIYAKDKKFQKYLKQDAKHFKRKLNKDQLNFFLEEHLLSY